jgi:hypothetical protein
MEHFTMPFMGGKGGYLLLRGLGRCLREMFEGDSADTCIKKNPLVLMGAECRVKHAQTQK